MVVLLSGTMEVFPCQCLTTEVYIGCINLVPSQKVNQSVSNHGGNKLCTMGAVLHLAAGHSYSMCNPCVSPERFTTLLGPQIDDVGYVWRHEQHLLQSLSSWIGAVRNHLRPCITVIHSSVSVPHLAMSRMLWCLASQCKQCSPTAFQAVRRFFSLPPYDAAARRDGPHITNPASDTT